MYIGVNMKNKFIILCTFGVSTLSCQAHAIQIFRVIEEGLQRVAQGQLQQLENNVGLLKDQLKLDKRVEDMTRQSMSHLNKVADELSGQYDMGKMLNGAADQAKRRWGPNINGDSENDGYQRLKNTHISQFNFKDGSELYKKNSVQEAAYNQNKGAQEKAIVSANFVSNKINDSIKEIEKLMGEIDKTPNQKASTDLNSRIQAQVGLEIVELKRMQALQLETMGGMSQQSVIDENMSAQFNRWA